MEWVLSKFSDAHAYFYPEKNFLITVKIYDICNNLVHSYKYTTMPYEWLKTLSWESILTKNLPYD